MTQEDEKKKKGCFGGCLPFIIIIFFSIRIIPNLLPHSRVKQKNFETELISYSAGHYNIKAQDPLSEIIMTNFNWNFVTSDFKNKNISLSIDVIRTEVEEALIILDSLYYLTDEELGLKIDYQIDPDGGAVEFWGAIYKRINNKTGPQLQNIADSLKEIAINENLNSNDLLWMTVTLVQNITYKIPDEELGIIPPIVSIAREYGDCDTTALLLHTILHRLGYETVLYYSRFYGHAMLGINTNATGEYKTSKGLNYYFLEVTNPGWNIGQISADFNDLDKWFLIEL